MQSTSLPLEHVTERVTVPLPQIAEHEVQGWTCHAQPYESSHDSRIGGCSTPLQFEVSSKGHQTSLLRQPEPHVALHSPHAVVCQLQPATSAQASCAGGAVKPSSRQSLSAPVEQNAKRERTPGPH